MPLSRPPIQRNTLPDDLIPVHYNLTLEPNLIPNCEGECTFRGSVEIICDCEVATNEITVHLDSSVMVNAGKVSFQLFKKNMGTTSKEDNGTYDHLELGENIPAERLESNPTEMTVKVILPVAKTLPTGKCIGKLIFKEFRSILNDQMKGFYRSGYTSRFGNPKRKLWLATTQFEPTDARMAFPCWDEPERKATFSLKMIVNQGCDPVVNSSSSSILKLDSSESDGSKSSNSNGYYHLKALSNMPVKEVVGITNMANCNSNPTGSGTGGPHQFQEIYVFEKTPIMSTYLLAFCVGDFDSIKDTMPATLSCKGSKPVDITCYSIPNKSNQLEFALKCCKRSLDFFNDFFQIPYALPKLDQIAIPDFSAGAMENWGLVTYREILLFVEDEEKVNTSIKKRIANVIAHELAHQWFGNLVTMRWWNDLWLNEGFATFMALLCTNSLFPEWNIWDDFASEEQQRALKLDCLRSSHPIQVPVINGHEVMQNFDHISYFKGESVIRMIYSYLGPDVFRAGLQDYMKTYQFGNTQTCDLWEKWEEASRRVAAKKGGEAVYKPVSEVMDKWTGIMGYPILTVDVVNNGQQQQCLEVSQDWFIADNSKETGDNEKCWTVPLFIASSQNKGNADLVQLMKNKKELIPLPKGIDFSNISEANTNNSSWIKLNANQIVPLRVLYKKPQLLNQLAKYGIGQNQLSVSDKIGVLLDSFTLTKSGHASGDNGILGLFSLLRSWPFEKELNSSQMWGAIASVLKGDGAAPSDSIGRYMSEIGGNTSNLWKNFVIEKIVKKPLENVGWDHKSGDSDNMKNLRACLVGLACGHVVVESENTSSSSTAILKEVWSRWEEFLVNPDTTRLPDDLKPAVFACVISTASDPNKANSIFNKMLELCCDTTGTINQFVKLALFRALGFAKSLELKTRVLALALGKHNEAPTVPQDLVRTQDISSPLNGVALSGIEGQKLLREWGKKNWQNIYDKIGVSFVLMNAVQVIFSSCRKEIAEDTKKFFYPGGEGSACTHPTIEKKLKQVLEETNASAAFLDRLKGCKKIGEEGFWK